MGGTEIAHCGGLPALTLDHLAKVDHVWLRISKAFLELVERALRGGVSM
jgi:hypothetical protein